MTIAAFRYNNPFDVSLPISGWHGGGNVVGISGQSGFASFPDMSTGYSAGVQRLNSYITGNWSGGNALSTIGQLNSAYATDPNWAAGVSKYSGIDINTPLNVNDPTQMANLQYGVLAQEMGPSNAQNVFNNYGPNGGGGDIWSAGTSGVPYSGYDNGLGSDSGAGIGLGGLGDTSGMSGYPYTGGNTQSPDYYQSTADGGGQGYNVGDNNPSFGSTVAYGGDNSFTNGNFYTPGQDASGNVDVSGGSMPELSTGYPYNAPLDQAFSGNLFSGVLNGLTGVLSGNSSNSGGADFFAWLGDWAMRGAVIVLGFIFVIAGLMLLKGNKLLVASEAML